MSIAPVRCSRSAQVYGDYHFDNPPNWFTLGIFLDGKKPTTIGYTDFAERMGTWARANTFTHEMAHYYSGRGHNQAVAPQDVSEACGFGKWLDMRTNPPGFTH